MTYDTHNKRSSSRVAGYSNGPSDTQISYDPYKRLIHDGCRCSYPAASNKAETAAKGMAVSSECCTCSISSKRCVEIAASVAFCTAHFYSNQMRSFIQSSWCGTKSICAYDVRVGLCCGHSAQSAVHHAYTH